MIVYSGHYPHTECLRHFSVGLTTNRSLRDLTPKCLRHIGVSSAGGADVMHHVPTIALGKLVGFEVVDDFGGCAVCGDVGAEGGA